MKGSTGGSAADRDWRADVDIRTSDEPIAFMILRWSETGDRAMSPAKFLEVESKRSLIPYKTDVSAASYLLELDENGELLATSRSGDQSTVLLRFIPSLTPRRQPMKSLIASGAELHELWWSTVLHGARWAHYRGGVRVREVEFGLGHADLVRGTQASFEQDLWDGRKPKPYEEPRLVPVPESERIDVDALVAAHPPENLIEQDGQRYLLTRDDEWIEGRFADRRGPGSFMGSWIEEPHFFLNLDTMNLVPDEDEVEEYPDLRALIAAGLRDWFSLPPDPSLWDFPVDVYQLGARRARHTT